MLKHWHVLLELFKYERSLKSFQHFYGASADCYRWDTLLRRDIISATEKSYFLIILKYPFCKKYGGMASQSHTQLKSA